ncbi:MAG: flavodoxin family protein [Candidatus Azobacteroides sp.]|nr:flavodoxin family protein [Candidatus Azobacteroides sp.]
MKILLINGSPRREGNTFIALSEIATTLEAEGVKTSLVQLGSRAVQGCTACNKCYELGHCVFNDQLYAEIREKLAESDGLIVGFPVYFSGPNGSLCSLLDRIFYTSGDLLRYKVGAAIAVCRRSGASATLDRLNKYFTFSRMLLIGSQYWNAAHGREPGEVKEDKEGLQIMRTLARNMAWTIKNTKAAQQPFPEMEKRVSTDFIRK